MANPVRKRRRWVPFLVMFIIVGGIVGLWLASRGSAASFGRNKPLDPTLITTVKRGDLPIEVLETGKVQPREKVEVKSKVSGQVAKVLVDAGAILVIVAS